MLDFFKRKPKVIGRLIIEGSDLGAPIKPGQSILQAATVARIKFPNMCNVGECGTCRCRLREGKVRLKRDITHHVSIEELEQGYILGCQAVPEGDVVVQVPGLSATDESTITTAGTIASLRKLTHDILEVNVTMDRPVRYQAGQYARLSVPGEPSLADVERNYSFAGDAGSGEAASVSFYIRHVPGGQFTDWLFAADRTGTKLQLSAPFGDFHYRESERPLLLMAGGSGLAPIKALLEELQATGSAHPVTLLFGARAKRDLYCLDEIAAMSAAWPAPFAFHPILSHEADGSDWTGARGFVTGHLARLVPDLSAHDVYMCGPPAMLDAVIAQVEGAVPRERIHFDKFLDQGSLHPTH
jgi:toluene methyl-monooxygenase electron transfer component